MTMAIVVKFVFSLFLSHIASSIYKAVRLAHIYTERDIGERGKKGNRNTNHYNNKSN